MGQQAVLDVQKAEMEAKIAQGLKEAGMQLQTSSRGSTPSASPTNAMERAKTPEERLRAAAAWGDDAVLRELLELDNTDFATAGSRGRGRGRGGGGGKGGRGAKGGKRGEVAGAAAGVAREKLTVIFAATRHHCEFVHGLLR